MLRQDKGAVARVAGGAHVSRTRVPELEVGRCRKVRHDMANDSVTLYLDGTPSIDDYALALEGLRDLLDAIASRSGSSAKIEWRLETLEVSSALTRVRGISEDMAAVEQASAEYLEVGRSLYVGGQIDPALSPAVGKIVGVINGRVPSVRFETDVDDFIISNDSKPLAEVVPLRQPFPPQLGAIEGRVETVSRRSGLRFVLFDQTFDKAVSCYLAAGQEELMRNVWGQIAVVEGRVKRDPISGRPVTIRNISNVEVMPERKPGAWRDAAGVQPDGEASELRIRRIRDAQ